MKLVIIIGSTRPGRIGDQIGKWIADYAEAHSEFEVTVADLAKINLPMYDEPGIPSMAAGKYEHEHTQKWSALIDGADAFIFVTPEYNFTMPPALLNAVAYLHSEWKYKPIGFVAYGFGGGVRAMATEKLLMVGLSAMPIAASVNLIGTHALAGPFKASEQNEQAAQGMLDELARWADALAPLRQK